MASTTFKSKEITELIVNWLKIYTETAHVKGFVVPII